MGTVLMADGPARDCSNSAIIHDLDLPMSMIEIAAALGVSQQTISVTEHRALRKLRQALAARGITIIPLS